MIVRVGVLALQGGFARHVETLRGIGCEVVEVRRCAGLDGLDGLVIPGGESTTLLNLMRDEPWFEALRRFADLGGAIFGTCAGAILLADRVTGPAQPSLGLLDADVARNAWGRQVDSFEVDLDVAGIDGAVPAVFIRAPRFERLGPGVETLSRLSGEPVLVRHGRLLAATFHPELTDDDRLHRLFVGIAAERANPDPVAARAVS